jgi:hypothetical protein
MAPICEHICQACGNTTPVSRSLYCVSCRTLRKKASRAEWRAAHAEDLHAYAVRTYAANAEAIKRKVRDYYAEHKEERQTYSREKARERLAKDRDGVNATRQRWRDANRQRVRDYQAQWKREHPEQVKQHNRTFYRKNLETNRAARRAYYTRHTSEVVARMREWRRNNPQRRKLYDMRRDARLKGLPYTMTAVQTTFLSQYWNFSCAICGQTANLFDLTLVMDHWIALADPRCPGTVVDNMVLLCNGTGGCNTSKQEKDPVLWLARRYSPRKAKQTLRKIEAYFAVVRARATQGTDGLCTINA